MICNIIKITKLKLNHSLNKQDIKASIPSIIKTKQLLEENGFKLSKADDFTSLVKDIVKEVKA